MTTYWLTRPEGTPERIAVLARRRGLARLFVMLNARQSPNAFGVTGGVWFEGVELQRRAGWILLCSHG